MSYTINKTDDTILAVVEDGTLDSTTNLSLIGRNYSNFGEVFNENLIKLLENFSNSTSPTTPLEGQLWWDKSNDRLNVYTGAVFKSLGVLRVSATAPSNMQAGDLWYDSTNEQLYLTDGLTHKLIGPQYTDTQGQSGTFVETLQDSAGTNYVVSKIMQGGVAVGYISTTTFAPSPSISGFSEIKAGLTFSADYSAMKFQGTALNADEVDSIDSTKFMRLDIANTATGKLTINNDSGLVIGSNAFVTNEIQSDDYVVKNEALNKDIIFQAKDSTTLSTLLTLDGSTGNVIATNTLSAANLSAGAITASGVLTGDTIVGTITTVAQPNITSVGSLSSLTVTGATSTNTLSATSIAGTLTTAAQTNITSVGTLGSLAVTGTATADTFSATTLTGTLSTPAQTTINQVGTLSGLQVSGSATFNNGINVASGVISGTIGTANQTNITSVGTLTGLTVGGTATITNLALTTDLAVTEGGTGASSAADARTNLGAVNIAGDTMTGVLTLSGVPTSTNHAATKGYVDSAVTSTLTNYATKTYADQTAKWQGANKHVSTSTPSASDGNDGDIWFVREA